MKWIKAWLGVWAIASILAGAGCNKEPGATNETPPVKPAVTDTQTPVDNKPVPATQPAHSASQPQPGTQAAKWEPTEKSADDPASRPRVEMRIRQGDKDLGWIVLELDARRAPGTVKNFLTYVDEGYYNGVIFHRIMSDFMIQGGGFATIGEQKFLGLHEPIQNEGKNGLSNLRGTISMVRTGQPHSATSQFFINVVDNSQKLDPSPRTGGWGYAVFGKVVEGMDVVDRIKDLPTHVDPNDPRPEPQREKSVPDDPPVIVVAQRAK